ncbi:ABC transporter ATP-binding protein [Pseudobacteroides cellulosolvens]|uniref:ABC transporter related protein n=1 Tax=Pseudobacteroides cellulosolvens ATCC 35603 = DSM 2933 TaxID=398512 RepID=A0A0L6JTV7_9FIRM|nr:ATP-binding cassette domain-containing protein [Pseudobacteroides cellulosolvens]KNY29271.1 ABC transporter related protein [Pseudobacteroides cellulosolvens ATCC 35603 = DSM 2933]
MEVVLEINELNKIYKNGLGIRDISLNICRGDIFGLLGANGSGKTTVMKVITGLMKADSGDVKIFGHSINTQYEKAMKNVGCMIETPESYPYLTAYENLKQISRYYDYIDNIRIDEVLDIVGILKYKNEKTKNFSLGMKQRLGIATAILSNPKLVILDEPLNGLDVDGMVAMRNLIRKLSDEEGTTFLISSHLIHDVELTCNRVGVIFNGKLINEDYTSNILRDYSTLENYFISEVDSNGRT